MGNDGVRLGAAPVSTRQRRPHRLVLGWFASLTAALWGFAWIAGEVAEGDTHAFDRLLLLALRNPADPADPIGPPWLEIAARDLTALGGIPVLALVTLAAVGFLLVVHKRNAALLLLTAVGSGLLLASGLKSLFDRPRPDLVPHAVEVYTQSFPSSHAMLSAVAYLTVAVLLARTQPQPRVTGYLLAVAILLTLLIGLSRVYLGVHWPSDVLAGWCAGAAWAMLCGTVALWLQRRGAVEPPQTGPSP